MKSFSYITAMVVAAGALTGFLLPSILPYPQNAPAQTVVERAELAVDESPALQKVAYYGATLRDFVTGSNTAEAYKVPAGAATMLLNQRIVVLKDGVTSDQTELPKGTRVKLVASEGRFVRVAHGNRIVTIPRSAVVLGLARTN